MSHRLLDPVPFEVGVEVDQSGWRYRLVEDGPELVLQTFQGDAWVDMYGFVPETGRSNRHRGQQLVHSDPPGLAVREGGLLRRAVGGPVSLRVRRRRGPPAERAAGAESTSTEVALDALPDLLASRFHLAGVRFDPTGRLDITGPR